MSMHRVVVRPLAYVCFASWLCASRIASATPNEHPAPLDSTPGSLVRIDSGHPADYAVRPRDTSTARHPVSLYLHGMCGDPGNGCAYLRAATPDGQWLVCPSAPVHCEGGGTMWGSSPSVHRVSVQRAITELTQRAPTEVDTNTPGVVIGFSQGAYVAMGLLRSAPGRYRGAVFIGAYVAPTRAQLEAAGVHRVIFAAGHDDGTHASLVAAAARLAHEGFPARFVELGRVGHSYAHMMGPTAWRDALAWVSGG